MHRETIKHRQAHKTDEHVYTKRHTDTQTSIQKRRAQTQTHRHTLMHTGRHMHVELHTDTKTSIYTDIELYTDKNTHKYIYAPHRYTHTHMLTYTDTQRDT